MKSLSVIGNGKVNKDLSNIIDKSDVVVRFNNLDNYNLNTGTKITIWVLSSNKILLTRLIENPKPIVDKAKLNNSIKQELIFSIPTFFPVKTESQIEQNRKERDYAVNQFLNHFDLMKHPYSMIEFPINYLFDLQPEKWLSKYQCPSNGYLITRFFADNPIYSDYEINLVGFSWEGWEGHPWEFEKKYLEEMEHKKLIQILK
jgi:ribosomal protein L39E